MRTINLKTEDPALLAGFLYGLDYANDGGLELRVKNGLTATLVDRDVDEHETVNYLLTDNGLEAEA